jgi:hypothetical protein
MNTQADKVCRIDKQTFQKYSIFLLVLVLEGVKPSAMQLQPQDDS